MTSIKAQRIAIGDRVVHTQDQIGGEVIDRGYAWFKVRWDDGKHQTVHVECAHSVEFDTTRAAAPR